MLMRKIIYILAAVLISGCATSSQQEQQADSSAMPAATPATTPGKSDAPDTSSMTPSDTLHPKAGPNAYSPECYKIITDIVQSSSFKTDMAKKENIKVRIDRQENSKYFLQLYSSEKDHESTIAWLRLDKANEKLEDITVDPGKPERLHYDSTLVSALRQSCP
jgi:guanyl-specific ribonuclease Sa